MTGHAEGTNWAVYAGSDSPTAMVYGPYDATYGQGHHTAQFKLMVDNNSGSDVVGSLDVVTGFGGNVLATRQVRRSDFTAANQWQTFTLQFDNPCFGFFEARVWWAGNTNMKFAQLTITPLSVASSGVQWLVTDQLGTPRIVFDRTGSLSGVSRHDYLPFGEELYAGVGGRTAQEGYTGDNTRQHFTGYENDLETGLNFAQARYQSPVQGRFTSVDPMMASASVFNPQSLNRYSYVQNNPVNFTDPTGMALSDIGVYQTANPEVAAILERKIVELFRQAIRPPDPPSHSGGGEHHGGPQPSGGEHNHSESGGPREHSASDNDGDSTDVAADPESDPELRQHAKPRTRTQEQTLAFTTVSGGPNSASWQIKWKLANPSKAGGWIVQELTVTDQSGKQVAHYWEAWRVPAKSRFTIYNGKYRYDDAFEGDRGDKASASAAFYEGLQLPSSFITNNPSNYAQILPSTTTNPNLPTSNATRPVIRTSTVP